MDNEEIELVWIRGVDTFKRQLISSMVAGVAVAVFTYLAQTQISNEVFKNVTVLKDK